MTPAEAIEAIRRYIAGELRFEQTGDGMFRRKLPQGLDVRWRWRNAPEKPMLEASLQSAVEASRPGFLKLMLRRLDRDLASMPSAEARKAQEAMRKREQEHERRSKAAKAGWRRRKRYEKMRKRARAARKAAKTQKRRRKQ